MEQVPSHISIRLNGEDRPFTGKTVGDLLSELGLAGKRVAVERNRELVLRSELETTPLASGDEIEIIHFVGGG